MIIIIQKKKTVFFCFKIDVEPEPLDCDKPQSFENNFVHHMAVGETVVGTLWTSFAGVCIEKLLDELLKVDLYTFVFRKKPHIIFFRMELIKKNPFRKNLKKHLNQQQQQVQHPQHQ